MTYRRYFGGGSGVTGFPRSILSWGERGEGTGASQFKAELIVDSSRCRGYRCTFVWPRIPDSFGATRNSRVYRVSGSGFVRGSEQRPWGTCVTNKQKAPPNNLRVNSFLLRWFLDPGGWTRRDTAGSVHTVVGAFLLTSNHMPVHS